MPPRSSLSANSVIPAPEQFATLLDSVRELIAFVNLEGCIRFASPGFGAVLGFYPSELIGKSFLSLVHEHDALVVTQRFREIIVSSNGSATARCRLLMMDGGWRWFDVTTQKHPFDSTTEEIIVNCVDVTALHRMEGERQVIFEVIHALNQTANLGQLLRSIHQALTRVMYAENCFVALYHPDEDSFHFPFLVDKFESSHGIQPRGRSCTDLVFRTGHAMLIPQKEFDRLAEKGEVELVGPPSPAWLGVPLKTPTATIGVLALQHYEEENAYDQRDLEFLESVGGHIALAIERRRAEEALRNSESVFRLFFEHNPLPTWVFDNETLRFLRVNDAATTLYGYSAQEFEAMTVLDIRPSEDREGFKEHLHLSNDDGHHKAHARHLRKDGKLLEIELISHQLDYLGRRVRLVVAQDVGERHLLEEQLRQAQKMEAVGRLAGGVAHDFNNLLMVIKGHTELLLNVLPPSDHVSRKIQQIDRAADRAASLTRQLLAFSRMQVLQPRLMDLNGIVQEMGNLLPRLIGEDIELVICPAADLGTIRADASQMEQVIMNLAVNARDAMPSGGKLLIETSNADLDQNYVSAHPIIQPGKYVLLAVSDNGTGMDAQTQAHIFEPFFTTKEQGKGTGLGLATVYGVVKQSGGFIWVYSEIGQGTSFKIYLPRVEAPAEKTGAPKLIAEAPRGTETVLLAEDEQDVREVAREFLESGGYKVLEAHDGSHALRLVTEHVGEIDLLVTDMVMPGMTGQELAGRLQQHCESLRVLYMSGYSEHAAAEAAERNGSRVLTKPFSRVAILRTVREILNESHLH